MVFDRWHSLINPGDTNVDAAYDEPLPEEITVQQHRLYQY
jgi:hypothetical protein